MKSQKYYWRVEKTSGYEYTSYFVTERRDENGRQLIGFLMCQPVKKRGDAIKLARHKFFELKMAMTQIQHLRRGH